MEQVDTPKEQQLIGYFQTQMPGFRVYCNWKIDLHSFRFYFDDEHHHRYILDVDQGLLQERTVAQLTRKLEEAGWKRMLQNYPRRIVHYSDKGFTV